MARVNERVLEMVREILRREGGFVDDPADKGGATNHGISLRYARGIGLDLDGDGDTDKDDIILVTPHIAQGMYLEDFYFGPRIDKLPESLQPQMFDISVNAGPHRAYELLQITLNSFLVQDWKIICDGRWGPKSRQALEAVLSGVSEKDLNNRLVSNRKHFYTVLVSTNPSQARFLKGWHRRADEFLL